MATGTRGRRYWIDVFDVQTFHPRRLESKVGAAPNIAVERTGSLTDVVRCEMVALLVELRAELGIGFGLRVTPISRIEITEPDLGRLFRKAVSQLEGERLFDAGRSRPETKGLLHLEIAVHKLVLGPGGELVGTTCQAAR
jgi:hypothetical protein